MLVVNIAGLGFESIGSRTPSLAALAERGTLSPVQPAVPALTSTSQATILTGTLPVEHGIVANGWYFDELSLILNWQRSARLMRGKRLWEELPACRCANLFWRYATHASSQANVTERPTYWVDGRKTPDIYAEPPQWRDELVGDLGPFPLFRFWGPLAGLESTSWIVDATIRTLNAGQHDLILTYLPHLDYDHQRYGPRGEIADRALADLDAEVGCLLSAADERQMDVAVVSDYAFEAVETPVFLNRVLREEGWLTVQRAENGELLEAGASRAFAVCDQQVAHVYVQDEADVSAVQQRLEQASGVEHVLDRAAMKASGIDHPRSGALLAIAAEGHWFAYPYWLDESAAPDFAACVAIHDKPGFDPTELFPRPGLAGKLHMAKRLLQKSIGLRIPFDVIHRDPTVVRGSHGRIPTSDSQRPIFLTSWSRDATGVVPMQSIKRQLVERRQS